MAAAIAAADNVTNVRCPGLPVAGVPVGYRLPTGYLRSNLFIVFHCRPQVTWEAFWDPSRRQKLLSSCHPNFGRKSASNDFSAQCLDENWRLASVDEQEEQILEYDQDLNLPNFTCSFAMLGGCSPKFRMTSWHVRDDDTTRNKRKKKKNIFNPLDFRFTKRVLQWYEYHRGLLIQRLCLVLCQNCVHVWIPTSELHVSCSDFLWQRKPQKNLLERFEWAKKISRDLRRFVC